MALSEKDLEPEVIIMGTTGLLRIKRIGITFIVEQLMVHRPDAYTAEEHWKPVAIAKGPNARVEALEWLCNANRELYEKILTQGAVASNQREPPGDPATASAAPAPIKET